MTSYPRRSQWSLLNDIETLSSTAIFHSDIFNMLLLLFAGNAWARLLPTPDDISPDRPRLQWLKPVLRVVNHNHHFGLKEHVVALLVSVGSLEKMEGKFALLTSAHNGI